MRNQNILNQILNNTEEMKEVIVARENEKREKIDKKSEERKAKQKEAHAKFTQIKANVDQELLGKIKARSIGRNVSGYILKLIDEDINRTPSMFDVVDENNNRMIDKMEVENKELKLELQKFKSMSITQKLFWLFSQKGGRGN